jgi:hypothetical protein
MSPKATASQAVRSSSSWRSDYSVAVAATGCAPSRYAARTTAMPRSIAISSPQRLEGRRRSGRPACAGSDALLPAVRSYARTGAGPLGDRIAIASYLGKGDAFDRAPRSLLLHLRGPAEAGLRNIHRCGQLWEARGADRPVATPRSRSISADSRSSPGCAVSSSRTLVSKYTYAVVRATNGSVSA